VYGRPRAAPQAENRPRPAQSLEDKKSDTDELNRTRLLSTSTPDRRHSTVDPAQTRSPFTPTRRGQSNTAQGNRAFVKKQLGGMLRSSPSSRMVRGTPSTTSIPESDTSGQGHERGGQGEIEGSQERGGENLDQVTRSEGLIPGMEDISVKASLVDIIDSSPARIVGSPTGRTSAGSSVSVTSLPCPLQRYRD